MAVGELADGALDAGPDGVIYESRLELTRLLYADFDCGTEAVFAQPFLLSVRVDGGPRRHVPDFLILRRAGFRWWWT